MVARLLSLADVVLFRYLAASIAALTFDIGTFLALLVLGTPAGPAAALGYAVGVVVHWLISSRAVFSAAVAARGGERTRQKAGFVISALLGLALTTAIVSGGSGLGFDPRIAKLLAVGASFALTWLLRSRLVFAAGQTA
jgi:putative flippase GtrA